MRDHDYKDTYDTSIIDFFFKDKFASMKGEGYVNVKCSSDFNYHNKYVEVLIFRYGYLWHVL